MVLRSRISHIVGLLKVQSIMCVTISGASDKNKGRPKKC